VTRVDLHKLLGGYAAGTLTEEERRALFEAALTDQPLFDALADEEALREVLADPASRERVRAALADRPPTAFEVLGAWLRRPSVWALAGTMAAAVVLTVVVLRTKPVSPSPAAGKQVALATRPVPPIVNAPASSRPATPPRSRLETRRFVPPPPVARHPAARSAPRELAAPPAAQPATLAAKLRSPEPHGGGFGSLSGAAGPAPPPPPPPPGVAGSATKSVEVQAESDLPVTGRNVAGLEKAKKFAPLGLRYTLLRRGADDKDTEVPPDTPFSRGESARLRIDADRAGYLYVLAGNHALFSGPIAAGQPVVVETEPGVLHLLLLPEADSGPLSTLVSRMRNRADGAAIIVDVPIQSR